jgi:hypothetical protein
MPINFPDPKKTNRNKAERSPSSELDLVAVAATTLRNEQEGARQRMTQALSGSQAKGIEAFSSQNGRVANTTPEGRRGISDSINSLIVKTMMQDMGMSADEVIEQFESREAKERFKINQMEGEGDEEGLFNLLMRNERRRSGEFGKPVKDV